MRRYKTSSYYRSPLDNKSLEEPSQSDEHGPIANNRPITKAVEEFIRNAEYGHHNSRVILIWLWNSKIAFDGRQANEETFLKFCQSLISQGIVSQNIFLFFLECKKNNYDNCLQNFVESVNNGSFAAFYPLPKIEEAQGAEALAADLGSLKLTESMVAEQQMILEECKSNKACGGKEPEESLDCALPGC